MIPLDDKAIGIVLVALSMLGLYLDIPYSGWVLLVGVLLII